MNRDSTMAEPKQSKPSDGAMRVDTDLIRELAELLSENALTEIEVEDGDRKVKVRRDAGASVGGALTPAQIAAFGMLRDGPGLHSAALSPAETAPVAEEVAGNAVKSPMVGTAYLSSEPGGKPFVSIGQSVKPGDTLLIVEAMKVMNPITATAGGTVRQVLVTDGQPVEFDQPLIILG
jgi:acetyl-CoA carboxylase biotin carboxyl carrier protein